MMALEGFRPIFGEARVVCSNADLLPSHKFLFHVKVSDPPRLRIFVTDFHTNNWEAVRTVDQLEDMRDSIGVGGSWSEFVDYLAASLKSEDTKVMLQETEHLHEKPISVDQRKNDSSKSKQQSFSRREKRQKLNVLDVADGSDSLVCSEDSLVDKLQDSPDKVAVRVKSLIELCQPTGGQKGEEPSYRTWKETKTKMPSKNSLTR